MPKILLIAGLLIFSIVTLVSVASNHQSSAIQFKDGLVNDPSLFKNQKVAWKTILLTTSQYQPSVTKSTNQEVIKTATVISDSTVVGIILDEPSSALLVIEGNSNVTSFKIGEGWLENWVVESLQADTVSWLNTKNQQQYVQPLFDLIISETATNKKINKKTNGKRK
jgi:hypothetical protein